MGEVEIPWAPGVYPGVPYAGIAIVGTRIFRKDVQGGSTPLTGSARWSSLEARWAHNPKVTGSNPVLATTYGWAPYW